MTFQPGAMVYTQGFGSRPENVEVPFISTRAPTTNDIGFPLGKRWLYVGNTSYELISFTTSAGVLTANWSAVTALGGDITTLTGDSGTATPSSGNVQIAGTANQISTVGSGAAVTLSLPVAVTAPGSVTSTTTLTATAGNITATNGDLVASTAAKGVILGGGAKLVSGTGDPNTAVTAPKGSLYLRLDGSSSSTRAYINTDSATAWTAVTTAT